MSAIAHLQYGDPGVNRRDQTPTPYQEVEAALVAAGCPTGRNLPYRAARPGYIVSSYTTYLSGDTHIYVSHAGPGRTDAISRYADVLQQAGFEVEIRPRAPHMVRPDVVIRRRIVEYEWA